MNLSLIQLGLRGFFRVAASAFVAGWVSSPMSWSPDGQWLSYTVVADRAASELSPGWIFRSARDESNPAADSQSAHSRSSRGTSPSPALFRIWATHPVRQSSVLIEESHWPLSAPAWSPQGKSIAFGRFVPQSIESSQSLAKGRYEVVVQDGLDRKRVVWSSSEFELDPAAREGLPNLICSWSAEGTYLAIPVPGGVPAIEIVRTDTKKHVFRIERASLPSWSPDGTRCAFIRHDGTSCRVECVERTGQTFSEPRVLAADAVASAAHWSGDGRSVYAIVELPMAGTHDLEIVRLGVEPAGAVRLMSLTPDPMRRRAKLRGFALDFDRDGEHCFLATDLDGRDCDLACTVPRDKHTQKRPHPLDISQRIKSVAVAPVGQWVAVRFGTESGLTAPAIYDPETEETKLLIADENARIEWLSFLAGTATRLLKAALPPAIADGQPAQRPTLLPLQAELAPIDTTVARLAKLARYGSALCASPADLPDAPAQQRPARADDADARLFFHYLRGDYQAATADLEDLEPSITDPRERLGLLSVRAQLLWLLGDKSEARGVIDYLVSCEGPSRRLVEDTPFGPVVTSYVSSNQAWARYFSARAVDRGGQPKLPAEGELPAEVLDPRLQLQDNQAIPEMPLIDRGAAPAPFVPLVPGREIR
jgi:hypothetical protein